MSNIEIVDSNISTNSEKSCVFDSSINIDEISYNDFFSNYLIANKPCIIQSNATKNWPCKKDWIQNGAPNFTLLKQLFGDCTVPVADCNKRFYNSQDKDEMTINDYLNYWMDFRAQNYPTDSPLLYLKDWHCKKEHPKMSIYQVPKYFASDWLNEYYSGRTNLNDDYMFVYIGPKGSCWSANIHGRKRWLIFPPGEENHLRDSFGKLNYDVLEDERIKNDNKSVKFYDIIQETGEIIFVPSGWHHQVWNLEDTISINHNWVNGCNINNMWLALKNELLSVMREIEDCKEMEDWSSHCQLMLKASHGMNYAQFYDFLSFIAEKRINSLVYKTPNLSFDTWIFGKNHNLFDLRQIKIILENFVEDAKDKSIYNLICKNDEVEMLLNKIELVFQSCK
ncbi:2-oxoglutarate and iron-dependent oxygenase JMJD4 isoform X2 [Belonocnema kinseyi]|uniref:2-oxoglutarate and iron-dependent oxygenase JMJD4 isoform X2 n=1 Tax=Belonocnema kinseyi TaxID=2817044 RepID=UPI00143DB93C|nr:2-oxoglutarate and iron-dependent oxygenase JMJD4 isoform X2 [Belonocnema kinseyi]